jgi:hypothetical protein
VNRIASNSNQNPAPTNAPQGVDVLRVLDDVERGMRTVSTILADDMLEARAAVAELVADANRWRAVTDTYAGFQSRGGQMVAYISTPQWRGEWADFNDAIDRHFEINDAALSRIGSAK